ncbi:MAG: GntR family transcriptional regulator [Bacteroides sp.]|nr:GntR family transcriptional regulator [Bacteroides sp.]MCM1378859.1 GntR family transcriptional regulator [Bacteroides sp.]MCM1445476.1 GntR family transcriptional regulator [Prevotella sp.]
MMEFSADKPIYRQVADYCTSRILEGRWTPGERIPSTKELAVELAVNNRTVMKAYDDLATAEVIFQRRGMGYYVADNAVALLRDLLRQRFINNTVPDVIAAMRAAGISRLTIDNGKTTLA